MYLLFFLEIEAPLVEKSECRVIAYAEKIRKYSDVGWARELTRDENDIG